MKKLIDEQGGMGWDNLTPEFQAWLTVEQAEISLMAERLGITLREATRARLDMWEMARGGSGGSAPNG